MTHETAGARRARRWALLALLGALAVTGAWFARHVALARVGRMLVAEDPLAPAEVIVASYADLLADTLEAAHLFHNGIGTRVVLPRVASDPVAEEIRRLGGTGWSATEYAAWLLQRSDVPAGAIGTLPGFVDGTDSEIATVVTFAVQQHPRSLVYVTARSHSARARRLLRSHLPPGTRLIVRSPRTDPFDPESWWQSRPQSREVVMEYLRWANTFGLGDLWRR